MQYSGLRREIIKAVQSFAARGLGVGTAGNLSARVEGGFLITPTGVAYKTLRPRDLVELDARGRPRSGRLRPSSEWRFHRDIYRNRSEAGAVVHIHSPFATAIACTRASIPAFHYMVAVAGGDSIRCAGYATFGTAALSRNAVKALRGRQACLLANHGLIALGVDVPSAFNMALEVEELAKQYWLSRQFGAPVRLGRREMQTVLRKFRNYGKQEEAVHGSTKTKRQRN